MDIQTKAIHIGHEIEPQTGAIAKPIYLSTTFERDPNGEYSKDYIYNRLDNPNRRSLEQSLAALDGGETALASASGLAAIMTIFQALSPGDHVLASKDLYHGTAKMLRELFLPWGLKVTFTDVTDSENLQKALQPTTKLVFLETPSNPTLKITDIQEAAAIAHQAGARCAVDNTWATPLLQQPLALGADIAVYSTTKYFGGHSDVLGGAIVCAKNDEFAERMRLIQTIGGNVPSPFDCWLVARGIQTMPCRMKLHSDNASRLAEFLQNHPKVERVFYPGLADHPGHEIASRQMSGFGGMLSFQVKGTQDDAMAVAENVKIIARATSLGGVESLIEHRASIEGPLSETPQNLLRFSVGLEAVEDLMNDLDNALTQTGKE